MSNLTTEVENIISASFFIKGKTYLWLDEIDKCVTFSARESIGITSLLKEIMLRNNIAITYGNTEKMKLLVVELKQLGGQYIHLSRTSEIFLKAEDKKFLPMVDDSWRSHLDIAGLIWTEYRKTTAGIAIEANNPQTKH